MEKVVRDEDYFCYKTNTWKVGGQKMRVLINGKDLTERVEELEQREQHYFEIIDLAKKAIIIIIGAFIILHIPDLLDIPTYVLHHIRPNVVDGFAQIR
jgi:hypothetical protein